MARHRSPSGAQADDPDRTMPLRVVAVPSGHRPPAPPAASLRGRALVPASSGGRHLPAPPAASLRGRATVAAVAAGAVVAAGQTLASPLGATDLAPQTASALVPVADITHSAGTDLVVDAIGGDQLLPDPLALGALDASSQVDVQNLAKAVDLGRELARQSAIIDAALAHGAPEAHLFGDLAFVRPTIGRLTSVFGTRWGVAHNGIDIAGPIGTPIYALTDGVVEEAGPATGFGLWVVLRHADGSQSVYGHVNRMFVDVGDKVEAGEEIAEIGNRGYSTGPHLHFEIWSSDGTKLNPIPWLRKRGIDF